MNKKAFLRKWLEVAQENKRFIQDLKKLEDTKLNYKSSAEQWSILECVEHLNRYSEYYINAIENKLNSAKPTSTIEEVKYSMFGKFSIKVMHPENTKKSRTLKRLNPVHSQIDKAVLQDFENYQKRLESILNEAENYPINKIKIPVDVMKIMRLRMGECLEFLLVHQQRHIIQMKSLMY